MDEVANPNIKYYSLSGISTAFYLKFKSLIMFVMTQQTFEGLLLKSISDMKCYVKARMHFLLLLSILHVIDIALDFHSNKNIFLIMTDLVKLKPPLPK